MAQCSSSSLPQSALTLSPLLIYNSLEQRRPNATSRIARHNQDRETPLPICLGVKIHTKTRKRELVDALFDLELSISYDRVLDTSTELGNKICHHYEVEKAVCPLQLKDGLFTTAAVDNINHNPSSTSASDSFHGTGISLFQHSNNEFHRVQGVVTRDKHDTHAAAKQKIGPLPDTNINVPPVVPCRKEPSVPKMEGPNKAETNLVTQAMLEECR